MSNKNKLKTQTLSLLLVAIGSTILSAGCAGRAEIIPNADKSLRKTAAEFAADAARRHPYPANAEPSGYAKARAEVDYVYDRIRIVNLSHSTWTDVDLWINGDYVIHLEKMEPNVLKDPPFQAIFNGTGQSFPTGNGKLFNRTPVTVDKIELQRDGKLYSVRQQLDD